MKGFNNSTKMVSGHNFSPSANTMVKSHMRAMPSKAMTPTLTPSDAMPMPPMTPSTSTKVRVSLPEKTVQTPMPAMAKGGRLDAASRKGLPTSDFGLPGSRKYPMPDRSHAANAKARASQMVNAGKLSEASKAKIDARADKVLKKAKGGLVRGHDDPLIKSNC